VSRGEIAFAVISGLLINEVTDICPWLAIRLVRWAARRRYPYAPERAATRGEELAALIHDRPGKLFKLFTAVGFALHALVVLRRDQQPVGLSGWRAAAKRTVDVGIAAVVLAVALPLWGVIAVAIRLTSEGPVLFQQERVTKGGRVFRMYKFSTISTAYSRIPVFRADSYLQPTRVGAFLRRAWLDELPMFWNILVGDMSLVGPQPVLPMDVDAYKDWQLDRFEVRPGLTGLWHWQSINYDRNKLSFDDHVRLDLYYIENWSLAFDLFILAITFWATLRRRGAY
jgi:lipopolysaccharide/colanic/teichoic acid biosynthesis glycosyltransferase